MNPYRVSNNCEECLNRKVKSPRVPMNKETATMLKVLGYVFVLCLLLSGDILIGGAIYRYWGDNKAAGFCFPVSIFLATLVVLGIMRVSGDLK